MLELVKEIIEARKKMQEPRETKDEMTVRFAKERIEYEEHKKAFIAARKAFDKMVTSGKQSFYLELTEVEDRTPDVIRTYVVSDKSKAQKIGQAWKDGQEGGYTRDFNLKKITVL